MLSRRRSLRHRGRVGPASPNSWARSS